MNLNNGLRMMNKNLISKTALSFKGLRISHVFKKIVDNKILGIKKMN